MRRIGLLLLAAVLTGCGRSDVAVSGRVIQKGKPLPGGQLMFRPADPQRNTIVVPIDEQGNYSAMLPVGEVSVSVDNRALAPKRTIAPKLPEDMSPAAKDVLAKPPAEAPPAAGNASTHPAGRYVPINSKYYKVETSGIKFTVESGMPTQTIELE